MYRKSINVFPCKTQVIKKSVTPTGESITVIAVTVTLSFGFLQMVTPVLADQYRLRFISSVQTLDAT